MNRSDLLKRLAVFVCYQIMATLTGLRETYDVVIATNPALEVGIPLLALGVARGEPIIYSVQDIYPDVGVKLGVFRNPIIVRCLDVAERVCLRSAGAVHVISEGFKEILEARGVRGAVIRVIPNWTDIECIHPMSRLNAFSGEYGLDPFFVVMYAGNIGLSQGLEQILDVATRLAHLPTIRFAFVGDGAGREGLQEAASRAGMENVVFIPFQPRERVAEVLASADVSLVSLRAGLSTDSVPSKCYSILASGRPVIAMVDKYSDTWRLIHQAQCGTCVEPGAVEDLVDAVMRLYQDREHADKLGKNGRRYVQENHSKTGAARQFAQLIEEVVA